MTRLTELEGEIVDLACDWARAKKEADTKDSGDAEWRTLFDTEAALLKAVSRYLSE